MKNRILDSAVFLFCGRISRCLFCFVVVLVMNRNNDFFKRLNNLKDSRIFIQFTDIRSENQEIG